MLSQRAISMTLDGMLHDNETTRRRVKDLETAVGLLLSMLVAAGVIQVVEAQEELPFPSQANLGPMCHDLR